ncbi:MAG: hypothetical protein QF437_16780, partial [Planctomycetota bacterium]|nr:hypothetical protein [Planctomycetota bacterium]
MRIIWRLTGKGPDPERCVKLEADLVGEITDFAKHVGLHAVQVVQPFDNLAVDTSGTFHSWPQLEAVSDLGVQVVAHVAAGNTKEQLPDGGVFQWKNYLKYFV